jgi:hypothetical protein
VRLSGLEPETYGLKVRSAIAPILDGVKTSGNLAERLGAVLGVFGSDFDGLVKIIAAWPKLPEPIRRAIVAMADAITGEGNECNQTDVPRPSLNEEARI